MRRFERLSTLLAVLSHPLVLVGVVLLALFGLYDHLIDAGILQPLAHGETAPVLHKLLDHGFIIGLAVVVSGFGLQFYRLFLGRPLVASRADDVAQRAARNRQRMLEKVRHMWVEGVLEQSLYQVGRIELGFTEAPEAINHPWKLVVQQPARAAKELPDGMPMREVFDQFDQTLLLLGAPGLGKTTLLLELARDLIERATKAPAHPIPVVFNLSSWALKRPVLTQWLVDELNQRYDVPRKVAQGWVDADQVLPFLDGLDEVAQEHREACVEVINTFRNEHGFLPLVVCSRSAEYAALSEELRLPGAVTIQPLTQDQIERYLERAGTALSGVRAALHEDEALWELLDTPLMLSILALAYQGRMASEVRIARLKGNLEGRRAALFNAYIAAMFTRRDTRAPYTPEQTRHWLSWLAPAMVRHEQTIFYLEWMQPDWLSKKQARAQRNSSGLVVGLLYGLGGGLFFGLGGVVVGGLVKDEIPSRAIPNEGIRRSLKNALVIGLVVGLVGVLFFGLVVGLGDVLFFGLVGGPVGGLLYGLVKGGTACIQHTVLRLFLWRYDYAPLKYVRFLEHAKDLLFLRRVGGGYIFVHRLLMEHFAGMERRKGRGSGG
jgi:hypothetical protein